MASENSEPEVAQLRERFTEFADLIEDELEERAEKEKITRAENIHILVALGVLSSFIALYTAERVDLPSLSCFTGVSGFGCVLAVHVIASIVFIPAKLATITTRPIYDPKWLSRTDEFILPAAHVYLLVGSIIPIISLLIDYNPTHEYFTIGYLFIEFIILVVPTVKYGLKFEEAVQDIEAKTTNKQIYATGGGSAGFPELQLTNKTDEDIPAEDIVFIALGPNELEVNITQTKAIGDSKFQPLRPLYAGESRNLGIDISPTEKSDGIDDVEIEIITKIDGEVRDTDTIPTRF